jgi:BirA family transcriptional regulator, biotin operon repressor / biotin---[acetyl-CoA-carboxylase] ligase
MVDDFLDANQIRAASFIRHVEIHDSLGSTNDRATELARDAEIELPALVVARRQTAGRGRGANAWWSVDGALTFSVLLEPAAFKIGTTDWPRLSLTVGVAMCDALSAELDNHSPQSQPRLGLKWPNDIFLNSLKVCGILIESPGGAAPAKDRVIIGIGVNVNNSWQNVPDNVSAVGIALTDVSNVKHSQQNVLLVILDALQLRLTQLATNAPQMPQHWQQLCYLRERNVRVDAGGRQVEGMCEGIAEDGALLVRVGSTLEHVYSGSVSIEP